MNGTFIVDKKERLRYIGAQCQFYRKFCLEMTQKQVAEKVGTSSQSIGRFERGDINNALILAFYISQGIFENTNGELLRNEEIYYKRTSDNEHS